MSNLERDPAELVAASAVLTDAGVEILEPRDVPLGGPRAMTVRRTLPQRRRSLIGGWCFIDHYGPDDVSETGGMDGSSMLSPPRIVIDRLRRGRSDSATDFTFEFLYWPL